MTSRRSQSKPRLRTVVLMGLGLALASCATGGEEHYPGERTQGQTTPDYGPPASIFGEGGISIGGDSKRSDEPGA